MMDLLAAYAKERFGIELSAAQLEQFEYYRESLQSSPHNLTSITDPDEIELRHFVDSLSCLKVLQLDSEGLRLIDVGTGGGFPGLVLKIVRPDIRLTLLDSTSKKINYLQNLCITLNINGVSFVDIRAEEAGQSAEHRESYDRVVARSVAWLPVLAEYLLPLCKVAGLCVALKGSSAIREAEEARCAIEVFGGKVDDVEKIDLPGLEDIHHLITISKRLHTPTTYPRQPGRPAKKPILCG